MPRIFDASVLSSDVDVATFHFGVGLTQNYMGAVGLESAVEATGTGRVPAHPSWCLMWVVPPFWLDDKFFLRVAQQMSQTLLSSMTHRQKGRTSW